MKRLSKLRLISIVLILLSVTSHSLNAQNNEVLKRTYSQSNSTLPHSLDKWDTLKQGNKLLNTHEQSAFNLNSAYKHQQLMLRLKYPQESPKSTHEQHYNKSINNSTWGTIGHTNYGEFTGFSSYQPIPGMGIKNHAGIDYTHQLTDKLSWTTTLDATKLSTNSKATFYSLSVGNLFTYQVNDHISTNIFGNYLITNRLNGINYGGFIDLSTPSRFGVDVGMQQYYNPHFKRWNTEPIVAPYYRLNKKVKLGMDVGPLLKHSLKKLFK